MRFLGDIYVIICLFIGILKRKMKKEDENAIEYLIVIETCIIEIKMLVTLYNDWVLNVISQNLDDISSDDNVILFWSYFTIKRLSSDSFWDIDCESWWAWDCEIFIRFFMWKF